MAQYLDSSGLKIIADELKTAFSQVENNASSKMWDIVANLAANEKVKANTSTGRIYLVGQDDASDGTIESTYKNASVYMQSGKMYAESGSINSSENALVTGAVVNTAINTALSSALQYCGTLANDSNVSAAATKAGKKKGDVYVASAIFKPSKTYINNWKDSSVENGDLFIFDGSKFDIVNGENQVDPSGNVLAWDTSVVIATVDGTPIYAKLPSNPNSVTGITTGVSGTVTNSSTTNPYIKIKDDNTHRSQIQLKGGGITSVTSDANGAITISTTGDNWVPQTNTISNLNSITNGKGIWGWINANTTNKPDGSTSGGEGITSGGEVLSFTLNNGHCLQFASHYKGNGIYTRNRNADKVNTTEEWSKWKKLAFVEDIPTKLSHFTDDVVAGKYLRSTIYGDFDADTLFNDGFHSGHMLSHLPSGSPYGIIHTLSYRGGSNNTKPDFASQIFTPCGDDSTSPNDMFFRTSLKDSWNTWTKVITDKNIGSYALPITGGIINTAATTPLNIKNTQSNPTEVGIRFMFNNDSKGWIGYNTQHGTMLYTYNGAHRLGIKDDGTAYVDSNTLIHSGNIKDQYVAGVYDSYNPLMKITFNYAGDAVTSNPTWLACWNGYTLSYVSPDNVKAGSATKLKTPRKLWGQSFDGTGDVNGNLYSDIWRIIKDSTWNGTFIQSANYDDTSDLGNIYMSAIGGNKLTSFNVWATNSIFSDNVTVAGNVGIGTTSPTEKLDVAGNIKASGDITATSFIGNLTGNAGSADSANELNAEYLADLNNGTRGRLFFSAFQAANTPPGANYFAGLTFGSDSIKQLAMSYNGYLYTRYSNRTTWSDWKKVAFTSDIPTTAKQTNWDTAYGWGNHALAGYKKTDTNYYHTRSYSSGLQISTGTGVSNMYVPYATASQAGVVSTGDQTFAGIKTFNNELKMQGGGTYSTDIATGIACGFKVNRATINDAIIENIYLGAKNGAFKSNTSLNIKKYESISSSAPANTTTLVSINESGHVTAKAFYEDSDERLKTFGEDIKVDFDELVKLRKSHFVFNNNPAKQEIGVSAQEVKELYPEIVNTNEDGYLSVDYAKLSVIALKAVDILYNQNKDFERRLKEIEDKLK